MPEQTVNWDIVDTVMLDMDGTVLDLHFDDQFWNHYLPRCYSTFHGIGAQAARDRLAPIFADNAGTLNWYSTDFWGQSTGLDLVAMTTDMAHLIGPLPGALDFVDRVRRSRRAVWLVTNAHPDTVRIKLDTAGIAAHFDRIVTSHEFGRAKEEPGFWSGLMARYPFTPQRCLFVDDSPAVVAAAAAWGIGQVVALSHPDSTGGVRVHHHQPAVPRLADLLPVAG